MSFLFSLINYIFFNGRLGDQSNNPMAMFTDDTVQSFPVGSIPTPLSPDFSTSTATAANQTQAQLDSLQKIDPNFNVLAFQTLAAKSYTQAVQAEGAMSADDCKDVVTKSYHDQLAACITKWRLEGYACVVTDLNVDGAKIFKIAVDGSCQSLTARVTGTGVRCTKDVTSGVVVDGNATSSTFTEYATFVRPAGSVTPKTTDLGGAAHCPSCGAPALASATVCPFCGTPLTPGGAAWLLDKVSQSAYS